MSNVDHPAHYGGGDNPYEVIKVLEHWLTREEFIGALKFNIIKYQARAGSHRAGDENYEKAQWYSAYLVDFVKRTAPGPVTEIINPRGGTSSNVCMAVRDGECDWSECPQTRDGEPAKSGRHCPLDTRSNEDD